MGEVERGKRNVSFMTVMKLARAMDTRASDLIAAADL